MHACMHVCMYVYTYIHIQTYACMHAYIHIPTHGKVYTHVRLKGALRSAVFVGLLAGVGYCGATKPGLLFSGMSELPAGTGLIGDALGDAYERATDRSRLSNP